ncbi:hypothetical protein [Actinoplanes auranticolor]|uniref:DUF2637 domain-containing protein n=1 Tax=Actinoplanes auranticolor TaxID=47988 RepID=A0A919SJI3_9ACTN|nr:hypothetical protein [Actinoplanes auranticolor]GIM72113.1 hypothetical protein Aau02nite_49270 [Actinoplanes auranticolor]
MNLDDVAALYQDNRTLLISAAILTGLGLLLLIINRLRRLAEHRLALLLANLLTVIAAALATMVSASGMWKFFTDILGSSPLRIAFFAYIEVALFASALLARARLLREPEKGTTGVDGAAVWVLATVTASLSALDANTFREVCLRLVAPLVAAWMWERALAAERSVRLGSTMGRIHWAITIERIVVWLRLAEAQDRDVSEVDRARRRACLARARLRLHLLQSKKAATWRIRRANNRVIRQAMHSAELAGLADFPDAADEREATQMYMATLYGIVDATTPEAVARFNAWQLDTTKPITVSAPNPFAAAGTDKHPGTDPTTSSPADAASLTAGSPRTTHAFPDHVTDEPAGPYPAARHLTTGTKVRQEVEVDGRDSEWATEELRRADQHKVGWPSMGYDARDGSGELIDEPSGDEEAARSAVAAMRRFWNSEIAQGRVPTGAELSRAAGVPPTTGLGRRKRREWEADLPGHLKVTAPAAR